MSNIRLPDHHIAALTERGDKLASTLREIIDRYLELLARGRAIAARELSVDQVALVADALNGTWMQADTIHLLYAEVEDAIKLDGLDTKWGVDGRWLIARLRSLPDHVTAALVDAIERFRTRVGRGEQPDIRQIIHPA